MLRRFKEANDSTKSDVLKDSDLYKINSFLYQTLASLDKFNSYLTVVQLSPLLYIYILLNILYRNCFELLHQTFSYYKKNENDYAFSNRSIPVNFTKVLYCYYYYYYIVRRFRKIN